MLHVTDDALLLAKAAIGAVDAVPAGSSGRAQCAAFVLADSLPALRVRRPVARCEYGERVTIEAEVVQTGRTRDFFGFNRAKHAVVEAAILATRLHILPHAEVAAEFRKLRVIVGKTGGPDELEAMDFSKRNCAIAEARR